MTANEWAAKLDGREYREEITIEESYEARRDGIVIVYGASDDLMEFDGAMSDEAEVYEGGIAYIDPVSKSMRGSKYDDCADCDLFSRYKKECKTIEALWCPHNAPGNPSWTYKIDAPHETFNIYDEGDLYCVGIVFSVDDLSKSNEEG